MATREQVLAAISKHQARFARLGAHQIRAKEVGNAKGEFAVHVRVTPEFSGEMPKHVECIVGSENVNVPVIVERAPKGKPE